MILSQKQKKFPQFFAADSKSRLNFEQFRTKDELHSPYISEINYSQERG